MLAHIFFCRIEETTQKN